MEQKATVVDDYLRNESGNFDKMMSAMASTEGERPEPAPAPSTPPAVESPSAQQSLPLDEPDQNPPPAGRSA